MDSLKIGFIPLADSASLIVAKELGFFAKHQLDVTLVREVSWSNIRDKLIFGELEAAHMLAPMLVAASLGLGSVKRELVTGYSFGKNGNAVSVSNKVYGEMRSIEPALCENPGLSAIALKSLIDERKLGGDNKLKFAVVFPYSMHNYLLRYWFSTVGIEVGEDVEIVVVPPSSVVQALEEGLIDGYCVGEPWNTHAVQKRVGVVVVVGSEIWRDAPEKVLGVRKIWHEENAEVHKRLLSALLEASEWVGDESNYKKMVELLSLSKYLAAPVESISSAFKGQVYNPVCDSYRQVADFSVPYKNSANKPSQEQIVWIAEQMKSVGQIGDEVDVEGLAKQVYLSDFYHELH